MIYEVRCENEVCRHQTEVTRKHDEPNPPCPMCGSKMRTVINTSHIHLKGDGWASKELKDDRNLEKVL